MNKRQLILFGLGATLTGCSHPSPKIQKDAFDTLTTQTCVVKPINIITNVSTLSLNQKSLIEKTIKDYLSFFNIPENDIGRIAIDQDPSIQNHVTIKGDEQIAGVAYTQDRTLYLDPYNMPSSEKLRHTIDHEMFHLIKPTKTKIIPRYALRDGTILTGYRGLMILAEFNGQEVGFQYFEEAAAEACAKKFDPNYQYENVHYNKASLLLIRIIEEGWIDYNDLIQTQRTNDVDVLVGKLLNKPIANGQDIESVISWFDKAYKTNPDPKNNTLIDKIISDINNIRTKK